MDDDEDYFEKVRAFLAERFGDRVSVPNSSVINALDAAVVFLRDPATWLEPLGWWYRGTKMSIRIIGAGPDDAQAFEDYAALMRAG